MKKIFTLLSVMMLFFALGANAQDRKTWDFTKGVSDESRAALDADATQWTKTINADGVSTSWVNIANPNGQLMANGQVLKEFTGLSFNCTDSKNLNAINYLVTKLRIQKVCEVTISGLKANQKIAIKAQSANATATDRGFKFDNATIVEGPQAHFWGGTWLLAPAGTDNPTMLADVRNSFINNEEVCEALIKNESQFTNNQKVNNAFAADPEYGSEFLGGQNDVAVFADLAKNIKFQNITIYDQTCNEQLQSAFVDYLKGAVTKEEAMTNFYKVLNEKHPEIVTPEQ